jgi:hypothetical protein
VKAWRGWPARPTEIDSMVLAVLSHRDLVPAIWLPGPHIREERKGPSADVV